MKFKDTKYGDLEGQIYNGDINVSSQHLTSLEGSPRIVIGNFYCSRNNIESLKYGPEEIHGDFRCLSNKITNLDYIPKVIKGYFNCVNNNILRIDNINIEPRKFKSDFGNKILLNYFIENRPDLLI